MSMGGFALFEAERREARDAVATAREATARAEAPRAARGPHVSPFYARYLNDQAKLIRMNGGDDEAVRQFARIEKGAMLFKMPVPTLGEELAQAEMPSNLQGISRAVLNGATFGFGDEAIGAMYGKLVGVGARAGIDAYRAEYDAWAEAHGGAKIASEIVGGLVTGGAFGVGKTVLGTAGRAAVAGAVAGAGNAEGGGLARTRAALTGAAFSGVGGAALSGAARIGKPIVRAITPSIVKRVTGGTPEERARQWIQQTLIEDGLTESELLKRAALAAARGEPTTILELGGEKTLSLAANVFKDRSPLTTALIEDLAAREAAQPDRLFAQLLAPVLSRGRFGTANAYELRTKLHAEGLRLSENFYNDAYNQVVRVTPRMRTLLNHPRIREAWAAGARKVEAEDLGGVGHGLGVNALPDNFDTGDVVAALVAKGVPLEKAKAFAPAGGGLAELPLRGFDMMKRELDNLPKGDRGLISIREQLVNEAREQVGSYDRALMIYGGHAAAEEAVETGQNFLRMAPEEVTQAMRKLTPNERDFFRIGAVHALYEKVFGGTDAPRDAATKFFGARIVGGPGAQSVQARRLAALFHDAPEAAADFMRAVAGEARVSYTTRRVMRLPSAITPEKLEQAAEGSVMQVRGTPGVTVLSAARQAIVRARTAMSREEADEITHLFGKGLTDPYELRAMIEGLFHKSRATRAAEALNMRGRVQATLGQIGGRVAAAETR